MVISGSEIQKKSKYEHRTTKLVRYNGDLVHTYRFLFDVVFVFSRKALAFSISSCILSSFMRKVTGCEQTFMAEVPMVTEH